MTNDPLTDLLDHSAPPAPSTRTETLTAAYAAMAKDAVATRRRSRGRIRVLAGVGLTVALAGGASAAAASGLFSWSGWANDPDITYSFTLPSGRQCEERFLINETTTAGDGVQTPSAGGVVLKNWARSADFDALIDVPAEIASLDPADGLPRAEKEKGMVFPDPSGPDALMVVIREPGGGLDVVPKTAAGPNADDLYATAVDRAFTRLLIEQAAASGANDDWSTALQMQCEPAP